MHRVVVAIAVIGVAVSSCSGENRATQAGTSASTSATDPAPPADTAPAAGAAPTSATAAPPTADAGTARSPAARIDSPLDAAALASQLSAAHATIVDPTAPPERRAMAGEQLQLLMRALANRPELDDTVLGALDPAAQTAVERLVHARQFLQARSAVTPGPPPPTDVPSWTIVEPEPIDTLLGHYAEAEALTGIPWYWLAAIHLQETRMGRIEGVSSAGAVGPMQFLPTTWQHCCTGDPTVTRDAIVGAATYLAQSGGPDDMAAAVHQYNPNDAYVAAVTAYAESLRDEPELYPGFHAFQVFYGTAIGTVRLPLGYSEMLPLDAAAYLAAHPQDAA